MATSKANYKNSKDKSFKKPYGNNFKGKTAFDNKYEEFKNDFSTGGEVESDLYYENLVAERRLDREKKIKRKKVQDKDSAIQEKKVPKKYKSSKNIDWTKEYADGRLDEEDFYDDYL